MSADYEPNLETLFANSGTLAGNHIRTGYLLDVQR
jgi:hypothetical protein